MNKINCTMVVFAIISICISAFTFVNLMIIEDAEEVVNVVSIVPTLKPAKADAASEPLCMIEEPIEEVVEPEQEPTVEEKLSELPTANVYSEEAVYLAKTIWGEGRGLSDTEKAAIVWCILNRVDDNRFPDNIIDVITAKNQFHGYKEHFPVEDELYDLAVDILGRWELEKAGHENVGRVLPQNYLYFHGDGKHNYFRTDYRSKDYWDWSLESPYED